MNKVAALRTTFKRQQERFIEFLQLSEEYANKYLLDISAKIQQQSTILDNLEERLEAANKLQGDAVNLQMFYESGTASIMKDLRATGKAVPCVRRDQILRVLISRLSRPLPQDNALFCEVDLVLAEISTILRGIEQIREQRVCCFSLSIFQPIKILCLESATKR